MTEAVKDDVVCTAGRHVKCVHKRNSLFLGGQVKGQTCAILADDKVCKFAGTVIE